MCRLHGQPKGVRGATFLEVLVVMAVFGIIAAAISPMFSGIFYRRFVDLAAAGAADALREAQFSAMTGLTPGSFGVHFEGGQYVFFRGAAYLAGAPENVAHQLESGVAITSVNLNGGGSDIIFSDVRGQPDRDGAVVFSGGEGLELTVSINPAGTVDVN